MQSARKISTSLRTGSNFYGKIMIFSSDFIKNIKNGTILFCDPFIKGKKYFLFQCDKDPV